MVVSHCSLLIETKDCVVADVLRNIVLLVCLLCFLFPMSSTPTFGRIPKRPGFQTTVSNASSDSIRHHPINVGTIKAHLFALLQLPTDPELLPFYTQVQTLLMDFMEHDPKLHSNLATNTALRATLLDQRACASHFPIDEAYCAMLNNESTVSLLHLGGCFPFSGIADDPDPHFIFFVAAPSQPNGPLVVAFPSNTALHRVLLPATKSNRAQFKHNANSTTPFCAPGKRGQPLTLPCLCPCPHANDWLQAIATNPSHPFDLTPLWAPNHSNSHFAIWCNAAGTAGTPPNESSSALSITTSHQWTANDLAAADFPQDLLDWLVPHLHSMYPVLELHDDAPDDDHDDAIPLFVQAPILVPDPGLVPAESPPQQTPPSSPPPVLNHRITQTEATGITDHMLVPYARPQVPDLVNPLTVTHRTVARAPAGTLPTLQITDASSPDRRGETLAQQLARTVNTLALRKTEDSNVSELQLLLRSATAVLAHVLHQQQTPHTQATDIPGVPTTISTAAGTPKQLHPVQLNALLGFCHCNPSETAFIPAIWTDLAACTTKRDKRLTLKGFFANLAATLHPRFAQLSYRNLGNCIEHCETDLFAPNLSAAPPHLGLCSLALNMYTALERQAEDDEERLLSQATVLTVADLRSARPSKLVEIPGSVTALIEHFLVATLFYEALFTDHCPLVIGLKQLQEALRLQAPTLENFNNFIDDWSARIVWAVVQETAHYFQTICSGPDLLDSSKWPTCDLQWVIRHINRHIRLDQASIPLLLLRPAEPSHNPRIRPPPATTGGASPPASRRGPPSGAVSTNTSTASPRVAHTFRNYPTELQALVDRCYAQEQTNILPSLNTVLSMSPHRNTDGFCRYHDINTRTCLKYLVYGHCYNSRCELAHNKEPTFFLSRPLVADLITVLTNGFNLSTDRRRGPPGDASSAAGLPPKRTRFHTS